MFWTQILSKTGNLSLTQSSSSLWYICSVSKAETSWLTLKLVSRRGKPVFCWKNKMSAQYFWLEQLSSSPQVCLSCVVFLGSSPEKLQHWALIYHVFSHPLAWTLLDTQPEGQTNKMKLTEEEKGGKSRFGVTLESVMCDIFSNVKRYAARCVWPSVVGQVSSLGCSRRFLMESQVNTAQGTCRKAALFLVYNRFSQLV